MKLNFVTKVYASLTHLLRRLFPQHPNEGLTSGFNRFYYAPLVVVLLALVIHSINKPIGDFGNYYYASKFLLNGTWGIWVYDPASFNLHIYALGQRNFFLSYTPVPPLANLYVPFALMPIWWAKLIWNIGNGMLLMLTMFRIAKHYPVHQFFWWLVPIVFLIPLRNNFNEGQSYILVLCLLTEGFLQFKKGNLWAMALLWALGIHLKITPAFVLGFLLVNREFKAACYVLLVSVVLLLISMPLIGFETCYTYLTEILPRLYKGEINHTYALNYQSMQVMLKTMLVPDALDNTQAIFNNPSLYHRLLLLFKVAIALPAVICTFYKLNHEVKFSIWLLCSMLISGYGNSFSMLFLLLPAVFLYPQLEERPLLRGLFSGFLMATTLIPFYWFSEMPLLFKFPRLISLIGIYVVALKVANFRGNIFYIAAIIISCVWPVSKDASPQNYFITNKRPMLIYDIAVNHNQLEVSYFDATGPAKEYVPLNFKVNEVKEIEQVPKKAYRRQKSLLINDSINIYLSDINRGVGFNSLRVNVIKKKGAIK